MSAKKPFETWEVDADDCWLWTRYIDKQGYGMTSNHVHRYAHRLVYAERVGPIPKGMQLNHTCHSADASCAGGPTCKHRRCVNPAHLEPVTPKENVKRGNSLVNAKANQTHCIHGHEFTEENTYIRKNGCRVCKECRRINLRRLYARRMGRAS
jgi:hypothetical protein